MSNRFGRNQKRRMRSALAEFGDQIQKQASTINALHGQMHANQQTIRLVAHVLGENFVGLDPFPVNVGYPMERVNVPKMLDAQVELGMFSDYEMCKAISMSMHEIQMNLSRLEFFRDQVLFSYITPTGHAAFGMNREAWERLPEKAKVKVLEREVARAMVHELMRSRRKP